MTSPSPLWHSNNLDDLMAYAAQKYQLEFEPITAAGITLDILQIANMRELLDAALQKQVLHKKPLDALPLWAKIWPASLILGHYLRHKPLNSMEVLEIGAGCGLTGLIAAKLGAAQVYITDINEDALIFSRINALKNNLGETTQIHKVDVAKDSLNRQFPLIIGAEILYLEHLYKPLLKFLSKHLSAASTQHPSPEVIFSTDHRRDAKYFFKQADKQYHIAHKHIGAKEKETTGEGEKHLLTLHKLTHLA